MREKGRNSVRRPRHALLTDRNYEDFCRPGNRVGLLLYMMRSWDFSLFEIRGDDRRCTATGVKSYEQEFQLSPAPRSGARSADGGGIRPP